MNKRKQLIVISAPSGAGKTTLARYLLTKYTNFKFSISATTRKPRLNEINGKDYFFFTNDDFQSLIREGKLIEYEEIFGHYYGTLKSQVDEALINGEVVVFDIDVKGALSIRKAFPDQSLLIFIAPPSMEILIERLKNRGTEDIEQLRKRIERANMEMQLMNKFDYVVVNDDLEKTKSEIDKIISKEVQFL
ncbi:MAG: guanylate kinase [Candidatus Kapaibacteriales bacterium]